MSFLKLAEGVGGNAPVGLLPKKRIRRCARRKYRRVLVQVIISRLDGVVSQFDGHLRLLSYWW
jgi:hypothetical protein